MANPERERTVSFFRDSAARAYAMGRIIPFYVPLAPPGIAKAEVRRQKSGVRVKSS